MAKIYKHYLFLIFIMLLSSGCGTRLSPEIRQQQADSFATNGNLLREKIQTEQFLLTTYQRFDDNNKSKQMVVYIEGDGMAWISRDQLSNNPTPLNPVALELASMDNSNNVLYIARPCQYLWPQNTFKNCNSKFWDNKRGSEEVIAAINQVISIVKTKENIRLIKLVGYSGGGGIATLITARRNDIEKLVTVAGNLNYQLFANIHGLTPMNGSVDPITVAKQIELVPQIHYFGAKDETIPEKITRSFSNDVVLVEDATHSNWGSVLSKFPEFWKW